MISNTILLKMMVSFMKIMIWCIGVKFLTEVISEVANHVYEIEVSERIKEKATLEEFRAKLVANKPKKGKKKKGKKKKKK